MGSSPYVRRLRLGSEIRKLRKAAGMTSAEQLAQRIGTTRLQVQRLETADRERKLSLDELMSILDVLGVPRDSDLRRELFEMARDASEVGWWSSPVYRRMGRRQARWAEFECGARLCQAYEPSSIYGLVQTEEYAAACAAVAEAQQMQVDLEATVAGRRRRQRQLRDHDTKVEIVVEEIAIRRLIVPAPVMVDQLRHLVHLMTSSRTTVQVLPAEAHMIGVQWPREPFSLLAYPDRNDPIVAIVEAVNEDHVLVDPTAVTHYVELFGRCKNRALSKDDTIAYLNDAADRLAATL